MKRTEKKYFLTGNDRRLVAVIRYNENNVVYEETLLDEKGNTNSLHKFEFNDKGLIQKEWIQDEFNDEPLAIEYVYENDQLVEKKQYYNDGTYDSEKFSYDADKLVYLATDADGEFTSKIEKRLSKEGYALEEIEYDESDTVLRRLTNTYNEKGLVTKSVMEELDFDQIITTLYHYNDNDQLVERIDSDNNNEVLSSLNMTYENGKLIREVHHDSNAMPNYFERIYTYSDNGLEKQITTKLADGTIANDVFQIFNEKGHIIAERNVNMFGSSEYGSYQSPISEFEFEIEYD